MKKRCRTCDERKPLAEFVDPVLPKNRLRQVCDDCREPRKVNLNRGEE